MHLFTLELGGKNLVARVYSSTGKPNFHYVILALLFSNLLELSYSTLHSALLVGVDLVDCWKLLFTITIMEILFV